MQINRCKIDLDWIFCHDFEVLRPWSKLSIARRPTRAQSRIDEESGPKQSGILLKIEYQGIFWENKRRQRLICKFYVVWTVKRGWTRPFFKLQFGVLNPAQPMKELCQKGCPGFGLKFICFDSSLDGPRRPHNQSSAGCQGRPDSGKFPNFFNFLGTDYFGFRNFA